MFFLVMMLEAYYFGDEVVLREELGLAELPGALCSVDVESIRHPKNELKALFSGFDEIADGERIIKRIDVGKALANPEWAVALRTLMGWCARALGIPWGRGTGFLEGALCSVTKAQVES